MPGVLTTKATQRRHMGRFAFFVTYASLSLVVSMYGTMGFVTQALIKIIAVIPMDLQGVLLSAETRAAVDTLVAYSARSLNPQDVLFMETGRSRVARQQIAKHYPDQCSS